VNETGIRPSSLRRARRGEMNQVSEYVQVIPPVVTGVLISMRVGALSASVQCTEQKMH
jgi:hypothetical protein